MSNQDFIKKMQKQGYLLNNKKPVTAPKTEAKPAGGWYMNENEELVFIAHPTTAPKN